MLIKAGGIVFFVLLFVIFMFVVDLCSGLDYRGEDPEVNLFLVFVFFLSVVFCGFVV